MGPMNRRGRVNAPVVGMFVALAFLVTSCGDATASTTTDGPGVTSAPAGVVVDWSDPTARVELGDGWSIGKCEGDAPLLCVERDGVGVGLVEALTYPIDSFDVLDPTASDSDNLLAFADDFLGWVTPDRAAGCGSDYRLEPFPVTPFGLGGSEGVAYGYTGTMGDGSPSELNLQYATIRGDDIVLITAIAYDEGGCPGRDDTSSFTSSELAAFRPHLERVLADSPLPKSGY